MAAVFGSRTFPGQKAAGPRLFTSPDRSAGRSESSSSSSSGGSGSSTPSPSPHHHRRKEGIRDSRKPSSEESTLSESQTSSILGELSSLAPSVSPPVPQLLEIRAWESAFLAHCRSLPVPPGVGISSRSVPIAIHLVLASGISCPAPSSTAGSVSERTEKEGLFFANLSLFHTATARFIGATYTTPEPAVVGESSSSSGSSSSSRTPDSVDVLFGHTVYFHTTIRDPGLALVVELFCLDPNFPENRQSVGWTMVPLDMANLHKDGGHKDLRKRKEPLPVLRALYMGTPRVLTWAHSPLTSTLDRLIMDASIKLSVETVSAARALTELIPENVFLGSTQLVPGLSRPLISGDKAHLEHVFRLTLAGVSVVLPHSTERELAHWIRGKEKSSPSSLKYRLRVTAHTTRVKLGKTQEISLHRFEKTSERIEEGSHRLGGKRKGAKGKGSGGTLQLSTPPTLVASPGVVLALPRFIYNPQCAVICELLCEPENADDTAGPLPVVVGKLVFLPCVDEHLFNGGTRVVQEYMLSGPLHSVEMEPVFTSRAPDPLDTAVLPLVSSPVYLTFTAQGHHRSGDILVSPASSPTPMPAPEPVQDSPRVPAPQPPQPPEPQPEPPPLPSPDARALPVWESPKPAAPSMPSVQDAGTCTTPRRVEAPTSAPAQPMPQPPLVVEVLPTPAAAAAGGAVPRRPVVIGPECTIRAVSGELPWSVSPLERALLSRAGFAPIVDAAQTPIP
eukprot:RCo043012